MMNCWRVGPGLIRTVQVPSQQKCYSSLLWTQLTSKYSVQPTVRRFYFGWAVCLQTSSNHLFSKSRNCSSPVSFCGYRPLTSKAELHEESGLLLHDPKKGDLVYYGPLSARVRGLKILSVSSSLTCMALLPYVFMRAENLPPFLQATCGLISGFFIFLQPCIIHWLVYRYVTALYYNRENKTFTVTTLTFIGTKKDMTFTKADVENVDTPTLFERVRVKDRPLYMENDYFVDVAAFKMIMNYDSDNKDL
ncbi:transmembrane protein 70 homolog, mitochondrial-like [Saccostrea echinata]|uniref:transmembrane protein 70 homolog, mitochondrial-like n=1 Tax=Saccostrea echinata TaxID=191078 RepID=UPI002A820A59|nr:transmembrane protein 70 homolog, mitochondrial-like [Saccostrea echinata]